MAPPWASYALLMQRDAEGSTLGGHHIGTMMYVIWERERERGSLGEGDGRERANGTSGPLVD